MNDGPVSKVSGTDALMMLSLLWLLAEKRGCRALELVSATVSWIGWIVTAATATVTGKVGSLHQLRLLALNLLVTGRVQSWHLNSGSSGTWQVDLKVVVGQDASGWLNGDSFTALVNVLDLTWHVLDALMMDVVDLEYFVGDIRIVVGLVLDHSQCVHVVSLDENVQGLVVLCVVVAVDYDLLLVIIALGLDDFLLVWQVELLLSDIIWGDLWERNARVVDWWQLWQSNVQIAATHMTTMTTMSTTTNVATINVTATNVSW